MDKSNYIWPEPFVETSTRIFVPWHDILVSSHDFLLILNILHNYSSRIQMLKRPGYSTAGHHMIIFSRSPIYLSGNRGRNYLPKQSSNLCLHLRFNNRILLDIPRCCQPSTIVLKSPNSWSILEAVPAPRTLFGTSTMVFVGNKSEIVV